MTQYKIEGQFQVDVWNNYGYRVNLADWHFNADTWVYGEFLAISD